MLNMFPEKCENGTGYMQRHLKAAHTDRANEVNRKSMERSHERQSPEERARANETSRKGMKRMREKQTPEERAQAIVTSRKGMKGMREKQTPEERAQANEASRKGMKRMREKQTPEERAQANDANKIRNKQDRKMEKIRRDPYFLWNWQGDEDAKVVSETLYNLFSWIQRRLSMSDVKNGRMTIGDPRWKAAADERKLFWKYTRNMPNYFVRGRTGIIGHPFGVER